MDIYILEIKERNNSHPKRVEYYACDFGLESANEEFDKWKIKSDFIRLSKCNIALSGRIERGNPLRRAEGIYGTGSYKEHKYRNNY